MAMTEKQGGSDVRANTTVARALGDGGPGGEYEITGHKWFCSAPMSDVFLVLAQAEEGLSCFVLPRILPDGSRNEMHIQRLKDKLGNQSNASSEIEFTGAWAQMVGEPGFRRRVIDEAATGRGLAEEVVFARGMRAPPGLVGPLRGRDLGVRVAGRLGRLIDLPIARRTSAG